MFKLLSYVTRLRFFMEEIMTCLCRVDLGCMPVMRSATAAIRSLGVNKKKKRLVWIINYEVGSPDRL